MPATPRALRRSSTTAGSSAAQILSTTRALTTDTRVVTAVTGKASTRKNITNSPRPMYHPYIAPGVEGVPGKNLFYGTLRPDDNLNFEHNNRHHFTFHYNPAELDFDTSVNTQASVGALINQGSAQNMYGMNSSVAFQFMIARQEEVATDAAVGNPMIMRYGSGQFAAIKAKTFGQVGTLYDLEILFRTVNGAGLKKNTTTKGIPQLSVPFIYYTPAFLTFGKSFQFYGAVTDLTINHIMFTPKMVPTITYVQLSFQPISMVNLSLDAQDAAARAHKADLKHAGTKAKKHAKNQGPSNPNG